MQNKLQKLTEKIYNEGISKGNAEADNIIKNAKSKAETLINDSKKEAEKILAEAKKKSAEMQKNTESELKLASKQTVNALKQQITEAVNGQIIDQSIDKAFNDKEFIKKIIETTVKNWSSGKSGSSMDISLLLPAKEEKELKDYFTKSAKDLLDKGLIIKSDELLENGFQIGPKDGSYKVSFTDTDFKNFFKQFLRPRLIELLFAE
ncbi:MAG: hypothetical protein JXJ22_08315 [Bacteroidales bacterium]|nr:hypothetical protein [Bacteroidales bacterium]